LKFGKKVELFSKKALSSIIKSIFKEEIRVPKPPYNKILFLRFDVLGDMIVSLPVLRACRNSLPSSRIDIICSYKNQSVIENSGFVNHTYVTTKNIVKNILLSLRLRKEKYDLIINLVTRPSLTYGILSKIIGPKSIRVAGEQDKYEYFYTHNVSLPPKRSIHMTHRLMLLCSFLTEENNTTYKQPWVQFGSEIKEQAFKLYQQVCKNLNPNKDKLKLVAVNLTSGLERRNWQIDKYIEFIKIISETYKEEIDGIVIFSNPAKPETAKIVADAIENKKVIAMPVINDFKILFEFLHHLYFLVTPDTSILHAASATGTPVLAMIIGENKVVWTPIGNVNEVVYSEDQFSLKDLPVSNVITAFDNLILRLKKIAVNN